MKPADSLDLHPGHFVAVVGGAVAGSEAVATLADRGIYCAVFEQNARPYGKIEDGLPKWHVKLREHEEKKIDQHLSKPHVFFVPETKLGPDLDFYDLVNNWGFSAVLLANGAWRDRFLEIPGAEEYAGFGLAFQNPLVTWFNHSHEPGHLGEHYEIPDDAVVIGGGLASFDVVKILMLTTVLRALNRRGVDIDLLTLEQRTIATVLEEHGLTLHELGLKGCTLYYRRRAGDMPLKEAPPNATPQDLEKLFQVRERILATFQKKFLFRFQGCRVPTEIFGRNGRVAGVRFQETEVIGGRVQAIPGSEHSVETTFVVSSIGSTPEPIPGIRMRGDIYEIQDPSTGKFKGFERVFGLGNAVTGKGNIRASIGHGKQVAEYVGEKVLCWRVEDYQKLIAAGEEKSREQAEDVVTFLSERKLLPVGQVREIAARIREWQQRVNCDGDYDHWIRAHAPYPYNEEVAHIEELKDLRRVPLTAAAHAAGGR